MYSSDWHIMRYRTYSLKTHSNSNYLCVNKKKYTKMLKQLSTIKNEERKQDRLTYFIKSFVGWLTHLLNRRSLMQVGLSYFSFGNSFITHINEWIKNENNLHCKRVRVHICTFLSIRCPQLIVKIGFHLINFLFSIYKIMINGLDTKNTIVHRDLECVIIVSNQEKKYYS